MRYSIRKALTHFRYYFFTYLSVILEYAVGVAIAAVCFNLLLSCNDKLKEVEKALSEDVLQVTYWGQTDEWAISPDLMVEVRRDADIGAKQEMIYVPYVSWGFSIPDEEWRNVYVMFPTKEDYEKLVGESREEKIYVGSIVEEYLVELEKISKDSKKIVFFYSNLLEWNEGTLWLGQQTIAGKDTAEMEIEEVEVVLNKPFKLVSQAEQFSLQECIILPPEYMSLLENGRNVGKDAIVLLPTNSERSDMQAVGKLLQRLAEGNEELHFEVTSQLVALRKSASDLTAEYQDLVYVSVSILAIVMLGMTGVFIILLQKRRNGVAISLAYGATKLQVFGELFLEVFFVFGIGGFIGMFVATKVSPKVVIEALEVVASVRFEVVVAVLLCTFFETLVVCLFSVQAVKSRTLVETLRQTHR